MGMQVRESTINSRSGCPRAKRMSEEARVAARVARPRCIRVHEHAHASVQHEVVLLLGPLHRLWTMLLALPPRASGTGGLPEGAQQLFQTTRYSPPSWAANLQMVGCCTQPACPQPASFLKTPFCWANMSHTRLLEVK